ncbi:XcyI family restriction endonuclease [Runella salmonicolor]|uniref:XcyI family restriction endonuclease n=1 Tax=Runella salmonicolor TaxID=2950278 RepID=A0ABT1FJF6_9BACT|nr:XcyI family restriction endonuclease [Runella salmonicolor]MCP1381901.1 XcyI family restriction endonuclease [Runella salmonicolor]
MLSKSFPVLSPELQIGFHYRLKNIKDLYFHEALRKAVQNLQISSIDAELNEYVPTDSLQKLASFSIRGEAIFPVPILLKENPFLLGYYRLLLGFSQKEFYSKGPFGIFKLMEEKGKLSPKSSQLLNGLCVSLIASAAEFVVQFEEFNLLIISELQILTVGPQLRGSINNEYGQIATQKTFGIIKDLVSKYILSSTPTSIKIKNDSGRIVTIKFSSDPDIEIIEELQSGSRGLISIEIKGGKDISNIHNRIGEAEKSHQKARQRGYFEFMTIISVDIDYIALKSESPTTSHFFNLFKISDKNSFEYQRFKDIISSIISVNI